VGSAGEKRDPLVIKRIVWCGFRFWRWTCGWWGSIVLGQVGVATAVLYCWWALVGVAAGGRWGRVGWILVWGRIAGAFWAPMGEEASV